MKISASIAMWALSLAGTALGDDSGNSKSCESVRVRTHGSCEGLLDSNPIQLVSSTATTATINVRQVLTQRKLDWIGVQTWDVDNPDVACAEHYGGIPHGVKLIAEEDIVCDAAKKVATVEIFVIDKDIVEFKGDTAPFDNTCDDDDYPHLASAFKSCALTYEVPCGCSDDEAFASASASAFADVSTANVEQKRRLDAALGEKPSDEPSMVPTNHPTRSPTSAPTASFNPTTTAMPAAPGGPGCAGLVSLPADFVSPMPFCYDSPGGRGGRGIRPIPDHTCYAMDQSDNCGVMDFVIQGLSTDDFYRCSDVWLWFTNCVASYGCTFLPSYAKFHYGKPNRKIIDRSYADPPQYEFFVNGNGVTGKFRWMCPDLASAKGMKHFADAVYRQGYPGSADGKSTLFQTPVGTCESEAPSQSLVPSTSAAPTPTPSISCKDELGLFYPMAKKMSAFRQGFGAPDGSRWTTIVTPDCEYQILDQSTGKIETFDLPLQQVKGLSDIFKGTLIDNGAEPDHMHPLSINYMSKPNLGDGKYYSQIDVSLAVKTAPLRFQFDTSQARDGFHGKLHQLYKHRGRFWQTVDATNRCGRSPLCFDKKPASTCYVDFESQNCAEYDFVIADHTGEIYRSADPWEFFNACLDTIPYCRIHDNSRWNHGVPIPGSTVFGRAFWTWPDVPKTSSVLGRGGMTSQNRYVCFDWEGGNAFEVFLKEMISSGSLAREPAQCTESPTLAPTACTDGFLTQAPLNIALTIDISYSTYNITFDGEVGDQNEDGKPNTILDAEIAAVHKLLTAIQNTEGLNNGNVQIGVIVFESSATYKGSYMPLGQYNPLGSDGFVNEVLLSDLRSIKTETYEYYAALNNIGYTNFDDALDKTITFFEERSEALGEDYADWTNLMVFLSDGVPTVRGDGDNEQPCFRNETCSHGSMPQNTPDDQFTPLWERGQLSYCTSGDPNCINDKYRDCVLGLACSNAPQTMVFDSELARLDELNVIRLAIGVGSESDVSQDSALSIIDSNPFKDVHNLLPRQVHSADDLAIALRNLCFENTANPTNLASEAPTAVPTAVPTSLPTDEPTSAPTKLASASPSNAPTETPTVDVCEYQVIDFTETATGEPTGDGSVTPNSWDVYGLRIITNSATGVSEARYYDTKDEAAGKGIIIQKDGSRDPTMDPDGGEIVLTLGMVHEKNMKLTIFGATDGYSISALLPPTSEGPGEKTTNYHEGSAGVDEVAVDVGGIYQIVVSLGGPGVLSEIKLCRNPNSTPAPIGLASHGSTDAPTQGPQPQTQNFLGEPSGSDDKCPPSVKLISSMGSTRFTSMPIQISEYNGSSVKFSARQTVRATAAEFYTSYSPDAFDTECALIENAPQYVGDTYEAFCIGLAKVAIVDVLVSDPGLNAELDTATVPICCHAPDGVAKPTVRYTFELRCEDPCPSDGSSGAERKLAESNGETAKGADAPDASFYCKPMEFPCGDNPDMVQVCHYSSKHGYSTYCIHASESDVVSYMPKDSCGKCPDEILSAQTATA